MTTRPWPRAGRAGGRRSGCPPAPSTLGIMITSSASPASSTAAVRSSRPHGESRLLTRVQNCVLPNCTDSRGLDQPGAGLGLVARRHAVLEVGEQHVDGADHVGQLGAHLGVRGGEEVDHPARPDRDLAQGSGSPDGERLEEVLGRSHRRDLTTAGAERKRLDPSPVLSLATGRVSCPAGSRCEMTVDAVSRCRWGCRSGRARTRHRRSLGRSCRQGPSRRRSSRAAIRCR